MTELVARCRTEKRPNPEVTMRCSRDFYADLSDLASVRMAKDEIIDHATKLGHQVEMLKELP